MCEKLFWSKNPRPNWDAWKAAYVWRDGTWVIEGNSEVAPMCPDWISRKATLIAYPGKIPEMCISDFTKVLARHAATPIEKAFIGCGGNDWTWVPLHLWDMNMTVFTQKIEELIDLYLTIVSHENLVLGSLPFVYPKLRLKDMLGVRSADVKVLPQHIQKIIGNVRLNDIFICGNAVLENICIKKYVKYLDTYSFLKSQWEKFGRSYWWDKVHYDQRPRLAIAGMMKEAWGA